MITFRYHVASLVAVFLALAAGIALGAGVLQDQDPARKVTANAPAGVSAAQQQFIAFSDAFAASVQQGMTSNALSGRTVTLMVLPGASAEEVTGLSNAVGQAGGSVVSVVRLGEDLVDPSNSQLVDQLGGQLEAAATKVVIAPGAGTYDRLGTLLGYATVTPTPAGDAVDEQGKGVIAGLSTASLITVEGDQSKRGNLVLIAAGAPHTDDGAARGMAGILLGLSKALDAMSGGVVVAGPASAADPAGVLTAIRTDVNAAKEVSTVDTADHPAGVIGTVLALAEQAAKRVGQYGGGPGALAPRPGAAVAGGEQ